MARMRGGNLGVSRGFSSAVNNWTKQTVERSDEAFQIGSLDFFLALRDATPIDTGALRASMAVGVNGNVPSGPFNEYGSVSNDTEALSQIGRLKLGDKCTIVWRAPYAMRLEYGFIGMDRLGRYYNQAGRFFAAAVSSRYVSIMRAAASRLRK